MNKQKTLFAFVLLVLLPYFCYAQENDIIGFWEVEKVAIGKEMMTPVAKWFRINPDRTYQSGNGWLQSEQGHWQYNKESNLYTAKDDLGIEDEYGGFNVSFEQGKMIFERVEDGMPVKVTLIPIQSLPMSPADYLEGFWDLISITKDGQPMTDQFDPNRQHYIHIRWDRIYINYSPEGKRLTGYWHIHGHRSQITLLPHQGNSNPESWNIDVDENELIMVGLSDTNSNIERKYVRRIN